MASDKGRWLSSKETKWLQELLTSLGEESLQVNGCSLTQHQHRLLDDVAECVQEAGGQFVVHHTAVRAQSDGQCRVRPPLTVQLRVCAAHCQDGRRRRVHNGCELVDAVHAQVGDPDTYTDWSCAHSLNGHMHTQWMVMYACTGHVHLTWTVMYVCTEWSCAHNWMVICIYTEWSCTHTLNGHVHIHWMVRYTYTEWSCAYTLNGHVHMQWMVMCTCRMVMCTYTE